MTDRNGKEIKIGSRAVILKGLWESINGRESRRASPWVWVIGWPPYKPEAP